MSDLSEAEPSPHPVPLNDGQGTARLPHARLMAYTAVLFSLCGLVFLPFGVVGLTLGIVRLARTRDCGRNDVVFAWAAIVLGGLSTVALAVLLSWVVRHGKI